MLPLEDAAWSELTHAYGAASDTPELLRRAAASPGQQPPDAEPFFSLWSSLCHQGDVYSASYAAVPHLVEIAFDAPEPIDFSFFMLPASIEVARQNGRGPEVPAFVAEAYFAALERLPDCISKHRQGPWTEDMLLSAAAAEAVAKGHYSVAEALLNLDSDWIERINRHERQQ
ncbi:hypothetical protein GGQ87_001028 [Brevundimonas alba]|uniref:Uncharacterized protein n=1 Tax=Brevundimonas alba TaxID=74314 RepID=A0A7X5YIU4_9CAUL|nr:hypothetical protein [Brevundimonas alba]NJC40770.1 hypothetical protein [Brevundimonas alba]